MTIEVEQAEVKDEVSGEESVDELDVTVRLLDEGALVRWSREPPESGRCTVRVYEDERPVQVVHTSHDYALGKCSRRRGGATWDGA